MPTWHGEPGGNPEQFTHDVRLELHRILHSRAGRVLADCLRFQFSSPAPGHEDARGKAVLLMPYEGNDCNAEEDGVTRGAQQSVVLFTPATGASGCSDGKAETLPHEVLVHELVHALRRVSGHLHPHKVINKLQPYTTTEEFLAILVTNIFISDVTNHHKTSLRADHQGHATLDPELTDWFRFFSLGFPGLPPHRRVL